MVFTGSRVLAMFHFFLFLPRCAEKSQMAAQNIARPVDQCIHAKSWKLSSSSVRVSDCVPRYINEAASVNRFRVAHESWMRESRFPCFFRCTETSRMAAQNIARPDNSYAHAKHGSELSCFSWSYAGLYYCATSQQQAGKRFELRMNESRMHVSSLSMFLSMHRDISDGRAKHRAASQPSSSTYMQSRGCFS